MDNTPKFDSLKSIIGKILKSLIMNIGFKPWKLFIPRRHGLLGQTNKQPLSNFEPRKPWKYKQLWGLRPYPKCLCKTCITTNETTKKESLPPPCYLYSYLIIEANLDNSSALCFS